MPTRQDEEKKIAGLLPSLPIPEKPWESISTDFISGFPKVSDYKSIFVIVDWFSKYALFIPALEACPTEKAARLFFQYYCEILRIAERHYQ